MLRWRASPSPGLAPRQIRIVNTSPPGRTYSDATGQGESASCTLSGRCILKLPLLMPGIAGEWLCQLIRGPKSIFFSFSFGFSLFTSFVRVAVGRRLTVSVDDEAARGALTKVVAVNRLALLLIHSLRVATAQQDITLGAEIPKIRPADTPSRGKPPQLLCFYPK